MNEYEKKLIRLYPKTESEIINEIVRLRSLGFADYHMVAALRRAQRILSSMQTEAWEYTPRAIEPYFYAIMRGKDTTEGFDVTDERVENLRVVNVQVYGEVSRI